MEKKYFYPHKIYCLNFSQI